MKIGYVSKFLPEKDGGAIYASRLCDAMPCEVVRIGDVHSKADYNVNLRSLSLGKELARIAKKETLDLLHVQYVPAGQYFGKYTLNMSLVLAMKQKVPFIVTFAEVHTACKGLRGKILCWLQKTLTEKASAAIAHTPHQAAHLKRYNPHSYHIHMGLIERKAEPRKGNNVLFFGMLGPGKGVEHLIDAMDELPDYQLMVAGVPVNKPYVAMLREKAAKTKHGNVRLDIRWVPEDVKDRYYHAADLVALPYVWAPYQSGILHDALSYGKPIVVSKTGGVWEIVKRYKTGIVVPPGDSKAIARALQSIGTQYAAFQQGIRAYQKAANWKEVGKKHAAVYRDVLAMHESLHRTSQKASS